MQALSFGIKLRRREMTRKRHRRAKWNRVAGTAKQQSLAESQNIRYRRQNLKNRENPETYGIMRYDPGSPYLVRPAAHVSYR